MHQIRKSLKNDEAFLSYKVVGKTVYKLYIDDKKFIVKTVDADKMFAYLEQLEASAIQNNPQTYTAAAYALFTLLLDPKEQQKKMLVSLDSKMYPLNLETLVVSDKKSLSFSEPEYVLFHYNIQYVLSASTYSLLWDYQKYGDRYEGNALFVPQFSPSERIVKQPFMLQAAKKIAEATQASLFIEQNATKENFKEVLKQKLQLCMVGSHAIVDSENPLQSKLLFATDIGKIDPFYVNELLEERTAVSTAIITSCNSASGKYHNGMGLISLANGFLYSGAKSVVCSLWDIDEKTSATILENAFLEYTSNTFGDALRRSKIEFLKNSDLHPKLHNPYYWGGIILIGEDVTVTGSEANDRKNYAFIVFVIIVFLTIGYFVWKRGLKTL